jgi:hypothetical protein
MPVHAGRRVHDRVRDDGLAGLLVELRGELRSASGGMQRDRRRL